MDYTKNLTKIGMHGFSCSECGKELKPNDKVCACSDCGAIFCESCVKTGRFEKHECEPDDEEVE